jgi:hypothetical protein
MDEQYNSLEVYESGVMGNHNVHGTVSISLKEIDQLRSSIIQRDKVIEDLKQKQKKVKITLRQKVVRKRWNCAISNADYEETFNDWENITDYKNLDDIMDGLQSAAEEKVVKNYGNSLLKAEEEREQYRILYNGVYTERSALEEKIPQLEKDLEDEKIKNKDIKKSLMYKQNNLRAYVLTLRDQELENLNYHNFLIMRPFLVDL